MICYHINIQRGFKDSKCNATVYIHRCELKQSNSHKVAYILYSGGKHWERICYSNCALQACFTLVIIYFIFIQHTWAHTHIYIWYMQQQNSYLLMLKVWSCIGCYPFIFVWCCPDGDVWPATVSDKCKYYMHSTNYPRFNVFLQSDSSCTFISKPHVSDCRHMCFTTVLMLPYFVRFIFFLQESIPFSN